MTTVINVRLPMSLFKIGSCNSVDTFTSIWFNLWDPNEVYIDWEEILCFGCIDSIEILRQFIVYDYAKMKNNCLLFKEDLMKERFHPNNLRKFKSWGHEGGIEEEDEDEKDEEEDLN